MHISGLDLTMYQGDTEPLRIIRKIREGETLTPLPFETGDTVYFTVKRDTRLTSSEHVLQKVITEFEDGNAIIYLSPEDTAEMSGMYIYDIEVIYKNGEVSTLVPPPNKFPARLYVKEGVKNG